MERWAVARRGRERRRVVRVGSCMVKLVVVLVVVLSCYYKFKTSLITFVCTS